MCSKRLPNHLIKKSFRAYNTICSQVNSDLLEHLNNKLVHFVMGNRHLKRHLDNLIEETFALILANETAVFLFDSLGDNRVINSQKEDTAFAVKEDLYPPSL